MKIGRYIRISKNLGNFSQQITTFVPSPSDSDYKKGYITRYFIQKANDTNSTIYEISKEKYKTYFDNQLFVKTSLDWRITGDDIDIKKSNSESVRLASQKINKLQLYLPNLLQFRKK